MPMKAGSPLKVRGPAVAPIAWLVWGMVAALVNSMGNMMRKSRIGVMFTTMCSARP